MSKYLSELRRELKQQLLDAYAEIRTKEFWAASIAQIAPQIERYKQL